MSKRLTKEQRGSDKPKIGVLKEKKQRKPYTKRVKPVVVDSKKVETKEAKKEQSKDSNKEVALIEKQNATENKQVEVKPKRKYNKRATVNPFFEVGKLKGEVKQPNISEDCKKVKTNKVDAGEKTEILEKENELFLKVYNNAKEIVEDLKRTTNRDAFYFRKYIDTEINFKLEVAKDFPLNTPMRVSHQTNIIELNSTFVNNEQYNKVSIFWIVWGYYRNNFKSEVDCDVFVIEKMKELNLQPIHTILFVESFDNFMNKANTVVYRAERFDRVVKIIEILDVKGYSVKTQSKFLYDLEQKMKCNTVSEPKECNCKEQSKETTDEKNCCNKESKDNEKVEKLFDITCTNKEIIGVVGAGILFGVVKFLDLLIEKEKAKQLAKQQQAKDELLENLLQSNIDLIEENNRLESKLKKTKRKLKKAKK